MLPFTLALALLATAGAQTPRDVRVATFNVQMLPSSDGDYADDAGNPLTNRERATLLAQRFVADDLEIVALQEVFDEGARRAFVEALEPTFPYYVSYIGSDADLSDSGLMLFSRYRFEPMTLDAEHVYECGDVEVGQGGVVGECPADVLGFTEFDCLLGDFADCLASKGAGLVRVALPMDESLLVAFSHFRASYPDDAKLGEVLFGDPEVVPCLKADERRTALEHIGKLVQDAAQEVEGAALDADVILLGDLNIGGNPYHLEGSACLDAEWDEAFSSVSQVRFSGCADLDPATCRAEDRALVDAWAFTTSPDDLGRTSGFPFTTDLADASLVSEGERLDYVAVRAPAFGSLLDAMVPQHLTIDWTLAGPVGGQSDHLPVAVDLLLPGPDRTVAHATPAEAALAIVPPTGDVSVSLEITTPGQMQWTRVEGRPGTYTVRTSSATVAADVYASTDLSRPIEPRRVSDLDGGGWVYVLPNPPYYVRTFVVAPGTRDHDRTATQTYAVSVHEHQCKSPMEPCILTAGEVVSPVVVEWPAGTPVNPEDSMYFEFYADDPDVQPTRTFHEFEVGGDGVNPLPKFEFEALDRAALPLDVVWTDLAIDADRVARRADKLHGNRGSTPSFANHLLRVTRDPSDLGWGGSVRVMHRTNLTYFTPLTLEVLQENDDSAHDELRIYLEPTPLAPFHDTVSGGDVHLYASQFVGLPQIDEVEDGGAPWPAASLGSRRLTAELPLLMVEDDDEDGDPEAGDFLFAEPHPQAGLGSASGRALAVLALDRTGARATWLFTDDPTVADDDSGYRYRFVFDVSHTPPCFTTCP